MLIILQCASLDRWPQLFPLADVSLRHEKRSALPAFYPSNNCTRITAGRFHLPVNVSYFDAYRRMPALPTMDL
jgi:hypothetical protein